MAELKNVGNLVRHGGVSALCKVVIDRILGRLIGFRCAHVLITLPGPSDTTLVGMRERFEVKELDTDTIHALMQDHGNQFYGPVIETALEKQDRCVAAMDRETGQMVNFVWYSVKPSYTHALDGYFNFDSRYFYAYHSYTRPQYRGRRLSKLVGSYAMEMLTGEGYAGQISMIEWSNFRSLRSIYKRNTELAGKIIRYRLGKKWFTHIRRIRGDIDFDFHLAEPGTSEPGADQ